MVGHNGTTESTLIKAKFLSDIRKTVIRHDNDLTFNDLVLMIQRIFSIKPNLPIRLKYKDADGDFITLSDDNDLLLALHLQKSLFIEVLMDCSASAQMQDIESNLTCIRKCLDELTKNIGTVAACCSPEEAKAPVSREASAQPALSSSSCCPPSQPSPPASTEVTPATIKPSLHEEIHTDGARSEFTSVNHDEDIHLGGDAAAEFAEYPPPSIPSFPHAQAPPPPLDANSGYNPQQQQNAYGAQAQATAPPASIYSAPPQQQQHQAPPSSAGGFPQSAPQSYAPPQSSQQQQGFAPPPPSSQVAPPMHQSYGSPPPSQVQYGAPNQASFAPPTSHVYAPPSSTPPTPQQSAPPTPYGLPAGAPPPQSQMQQQQQFSAPPAFAPQTSQYGAPMQQYPGAPPPFQPPSGGFAPPPVGGNAPPGMNPFARPPTGDFRGSPYQQ